MEGYVIAENIGMVNFWVYHMKIVQYFILKSIF